MTLQRPQTADHRPLTRNEEPTLLPAPYFITLALLSGGGLLLEIALTRLFSTLFFPPYVFAIISVAVLGIGLGAAAATIRPAWRAPYRIPLYLALTSFSTLALLLISVWTVSVDLRDTLLAVVLFPYLFIGLTLATMFSLAPSASPRLYRADLLGAGMGVILAIPILDLLGGVNSIIFAAGIFGVAAVTLSFSTFHVRRGSVTLDRRLMRSLPVGQIGSELKPPSNSPRWGENPSTSPPLGGIEGGLFSRFWPLILCVLAAIGLITNILPSTQWLTVDMAGLTSSKPIIESLAAGGRIIHTEWDSFARTDLVDPGQGKPYELYIDGAAGSVMPPAGDLNLLRTDIGFFPFATAQPKKALVVGPGGGLDVWFGLNARAQSITAVEINPASVEIVNQFVAYHGDLYRQPEVRVVVDEGRSLLRREAEQYDLIFLSQVVTLAAERNGYALTENTIYTVEAFVDYLNHLEPGGQIAMKLYDELTLTRAMVTAVTALSQARDLSDAEAMAHIAVFLDPDSDPPIPLLMVQDQPFGREEALSYAGVASQVDFVPLFVPGAAASPALERLLSGQSTLADIISTSSSNVAPTTDDQPFFYQFEPGLPESLLPLLWGLGGVVLVGIIGLAVAQRPIVELPVRYAPIYFAALGVGFIAIEIALIQQTRLFLGHPTLAVTVILGVLLVGGGVGSDIAGRCPDAQQHKRLVGVIILIVLLTLIWLVVWPWLSQSFVTAQTPGRMVIAAVSVLPLALLMGIPFPLGLRFVGQFEHGDRHVALGWAVNGVMTVVGSAAAVAVALLAGFSSVLLVGVGAYVIAGVAAFLILR